MRSDFLVAAAFVELRFGQRFLGGRDAEPRLRKVAFGRGERLLERLQALHDRLDLLRAGFQRVLRFLHSEALAAFFLLDRGELGADRLAPLLRLLRALRELEVLDLEVVAFLAAAREVFALRPRIVLRLAQLLLERPQRRLDLRARALALRHLRRKLLDLALALQHAVQLRQRAVEDHALAAEEVAGASDQEPAGREHAREREAVLPLGKDEDARERVGEIGRDSRARTRHH